MLRMRASCAVLQKMSQMARMAQMASFLGSRDGCVGPKVVVGCAFRVS